MKAERKTPVRDFIQAHPERGTVPLSQWALYQLVGETDLTGKEFRPLMLMLSSGADAEARIYGRVITHGRQFSLGTTYE